LLLKHFLPVGRTLHTFDCIEVQGLNFTGITLGDCYDNIRSIDNGKYDLVVRTKTFCPLRGRVQANTYIFVCRSLYF